MENTAAPAAKRREKGHEQVGFTYPQRMDTAWVADLEGPERVQSKCGLRQSCRLGLSPGGRQARLCEAEVDGDFPI